MLRLVRGQPHRGAARLVGRRQVDDRQRARRRGAARDAGGARRRPARPAHDDAPRADPAARTAASCSTRRGSASSSSGTPTSSRRSATSRRSRARCRFSDCAHDQEPGLRDRRGAADGSLAAERWASYVQARSASCEAVEVRRNHLLRQERRAGVQDPRASSGEARTAERRGYVCNGTEPRPVAARTRSTSRCPIPSAASARSRSGRRSRGRARARRSTGSDGAWRLRFARPDGRPARVPARDRRAVRARPREPARAPAGPSATSRWSSGPSTSRPPGSRSIADAGPVGAGSSCAAGGSSPASACCCTRRRSRRASTRRCSSSTTARSTREYAALTRFLDAHELGRAESRRSRAALIQPVDRNETYSASALYAAALVRELLPEIAERVAARASASGWARASGRSRCCTRTRATRRRSTACSSSRAASSASAGTRSSRASAATSASRGSSGPCCEAREPPARSRSRFTCGTAEENRAEQPRGGRGPARAGLPRAGSREIRDAHTWTCWRDAFDPDLPALIEAVDVDRRAIEIDGGDAARVRPLRPPGGRLPVGERRGLRTGRSRGMVDAVGAAARRRAG